VFPRGTIYPQLSIEGIGYGYVIASIILNFYLFFIVYMYTCPISIERKIYLSKGDHNAMDILRKHRIER